MQRRLWWLFILSCTIISGCSQQYNIEEATTVYTAIQKSFLYSDVFSLIDTNPFVSTGIVRESLGLYSDASSDSISSDVELAITTDSSDTNKFSSIVFSGSLEDKIHSDIFNGSGTIYYISTGEQRYINRKDGYIDLGPGNTESFVIRMILDAITSQWMLIDDNELIRTDILAPIDGSQILHILGLIRNFVRQQGLFVPTSSSIAGLYPLTVSDSGSLNKQIQGLYALLWMNPTNVDISFTWSIQTFPEQRLVIQQVKDIHADREISGYLWIRYGSLLFKQDDTTRTIDRKERKWSIELQLSFKKQDSDTISISLIITPKNIANALWGLAYEWEMSFALSPQNILTFPIAGLYGIYIVNETQFSEPVRYILMSQLFGDEYGIARILESE